MATVLSWNLEVLEVFGLWKIRRSLIEGTLIVETRINAKPSLFDASFGIQITVPSKFVILLSTPLLPCALGLFELCFVLFFYFL